MVKIDKDDVVKAYELAKKVYAGFGIDTDKVVEEFYKTKISVHCWQGDDVAGFEETEGVASQNVVTGNYFGKARNGDELRADLDLAISMSPIMHKVNLHSIYAEPKKPTSREKLTVEDFSKWIAWAKEKGYGLDYNGSFFAHKMMLNNMSLSSPDKKVRDFWIEHGKTSREIGYEMGKATNGKTVTNLWIPDGLKDNPANKSYFRGNLIDSLNKVFEKKLDKKYNVDALEGKLFGIGTESFVVGSHEFYEAYALKNGLGLCLDSGHYHPTEQVSDKLSAVAPFFDDILLHVSRGVRWDSDHVVTYTDELTAIMQEVVRGNIADKVHIGLDYFDASINRIGAWVTGLRSSGRAMLFAMLEPSAILQKAEKDWNFSTRLALSEEFKALPFNAVWDYACLKKGVAIGTEWINKMNDYEKNVQSKR